jgi:uncharacterized protein with PIN domain
MSIELEKIDCNCNNCIFMQRDMQAFEKSVQLHYKWQMDYFIIIRDKVYQRAQEWLEKANDNQYLISNNTTSLECKKKVDRLNKEADQMKFQFNKSEALLNFGNCQKFNKPVSFIPNVCQLNTQTCFKHRKNNQ